MANGLPIILSMVEKKLALHYALFRAIRRASIDM